MVVVAAMMKVKGGIYPVSYRREVASWRKAETESD